MTLTSEDLMKIEGLLNLLVGKRLTSLKKKMKWVVRNIRKLQDMTIEIRDELDTEHELRYKKLEDTVVQTEKNTREIKVIKNQINVAM